MGTRDYPAAPRSPWQNGHVERLIGSIRRKSADHLIIFDEAQLRRVLKNYASYYNQIPTHLSLDRMRRILGAPRRSAASQACFPPDMARTQSRDVGFADCGGRRNAGF